MKKLWKKYFVGALLATSAAIMPLSGITSVMAAPLVVPTGGDVLDYDAKQDVVDSQIADMVANPAPKLDMTDIDDWQYESFTVGTVPVEKMTAENKESDMVILQLHGGGYVLANSDRHRILALRQATLTKASEVYYVEYRLVPDHVYPAALEDAVAVYQELLNRGIEADNIIVVGDSAGGNLAVEMSLYLKEKGIDQPGVLILESPWADFEYKEGSSKYTNYYKDKTLGAGTALNGAVRDPEYAGDIPLDDARLSPIHADLSGLPPMLIQAGGDELFLTECQELADKAAADGVYVTLSVYPGMPHDFALLFPTMRDSVLSLEEIRDFVDRYIE